MNLSSFLPYASLAIAFVLFLGASLNFLRGSILKGALAAYEASNKALTERVAILEKSDIEKSVEITQLKRENELLLAQRPSAEIIEKIDRKLDDYIFHREQERNKE